MPPGQTDADIKKPAPLEVLDKTPKTQNPPTGHDQAPHVPKASLPAGALNQAVSMDWNDVFFDTAADGTIWASSGPYKASFSAEGFTYVPFMGSKRPEELSGDVCRAKCGSGWSRRAGAGQWARGAP